MEEDEGSEEEGSEKEELEEEELEEEGLEEKNGRVSRDKLEASYKLERSLTGDPLRKINPENFQDVKKYTRMDIKAKLKDPGWEFCRKD